MTRRLFTILTLSAAAGLTYALSSPPQAALPAEPKSSDPQTLATDNTRFAFDLYHELAKGDGNVFFSPYSISTALAMTSAGSTGETAAEISKVMRWSQTGDTFHDSFAALTRRLAPPVADHPSKTYVWTEANRIWLGVPVLQSYNDRLKTSYAADAGTLDKDPAKSAALINAWTDTHTNHRITQLVSASDLTNASLVLTNAVFFKGSWVTPFHKGSTAKRDFHTSAATTIQADTLADQRHMLYTKGTDFAAVRIPYQGGVSFTILLPDVGKLSEVEKSLTAESFDAASKAMAGAMVDLQLPKFKFQTRQSLAKQLSALGMTNSFSDAAKMTLMAAKPLKISDVIHVADIELDEVGTEAAAATAVPQAPTAAPAVPHEPPTPIIFHADRPFIFVLRHDATGEVLFAGRISDPR